jgi:hypothetical protein
MKTVETIKTLKSAANEITQLFNVLIPKWKADIKKYDKVRYGFVGGGSDGWYKSQEQTITFQAWAGVYGDSSTYKQFDPDGEVFKTHLLKVLNDNKEKIMLGVSYSILAEAKTLQSKALEELNEQIAQINDIDQPL